jgi:thioredoxin 1
MTDERSVPEIHVACLCAAWCRVCGSYAQVFDEVRRGWAGQGPGPRLAWHWIDIEDESDWLGELDIETFPMLVVADAAAVRFAGPVAPDVHTLRRLLRALVAPDALPERWPAVSEAVAEVGRRLGQREPLDDA